MSLVVLLRSVVYRTALRVCLPVHRLVNFLVRTEVDQHQRLRPALRVFGFGENDPAVSEQISVASGARLGYTGGMKGRPQTVRCSGDQSRRDRHGANFSRAGFSLLELLIVVTILLLLITMYWGFSSRDNQGRQKQNCRNNLQKIYVAMEIYANEHAGKFPEIPGARTSAEALDVLVPRYTADTATFICPGSKDSPLPGGESLRKRKISYAYYMGRRKLDASEALMSDQQVDTLAKAPGQYVFSADGKPPGNNHGQSGGNFLFGDGRTESSPARSSFSLVLTQGVVLLNP